jgi:hypothetical protein
MTLASRSVKSRLASLPARARAVNRHGCRITFRPKRSTSRSDARFDYDMIGRRVPLGRRAFPATARE